jgi:hypothetical protein
MAAGYGNGTVTGRRIAPAAIDYASAMMAIT